MRRFCVRHSSHRSLLLLPCSFLLMPGSIVALISCMSEIFMNFYSNMKKQQREIFIPGPYYSRSTLLIPEDYYERYIRNKRIGRIGITYFVRNLLNDPRRDYKLSFLKSRKWKKQYQKDGQHLVRVNFYPHEDEWARLSLLSNATGFSRCYIFVYLMLRYLGETHLGDGGTVPKHRKNKWNPLTICILKLDSRMRKLARILQT